LLILNGKTVVETLQKAAEITLKASNRPEWNLPRSGVDVRGISYSGTIRRFGNIDLGREIIVLGYNHNIQSSFGVTTKVQTEIRKWIARQAGKALE